MLAARGRVVTDALWIVDGSSVAVSRLAGSPELTFRG
jgi:hypothetical protein